MRAILVLLGLAILAAVVLMSMGMLRVDMKEGALPTVDLNVSGGKMPEVKTGTVDLGTTNTTVTLPKIEMTNTTVSLPTIEVKQAPGATPAPAGQ